MEFRAKLAPSLHWSERGLLARVTLFEDEKKTSCDVAVLDAVKKDPQLEFGFAPPVESARALSESIERYAERGEPLQEVPWTLLDLASCTPFQREVYRVASVIPHGETRSYGWIAEKLGDRKLARAVGQALGRNPFPILFPCHRVVGGSGELRGFMGEDGEGSPELGLKRALLELEASYLSPAFAFAV